ncbi:MAG: ABC transporter permease [Bacillota bacterium]
MRNLLLLSGLIGLALLLLLVVLGPALTPHDPLARAQLLPVNGATAMPPHPPHAEHPLGTDQRGRDILSGLLAGGRYTLLFTMGAVGLCLLVGVPLGLLAGWRGGWAGAALQSLAAGVSAVPPLLLTGLLLNWMQIAASGGPPLLQSVRNGLVLALIAAPRIADQVRRLTVQVRAMPYIEAAVAAGATGQRIAFRHVLPNLLGPLTTTALMEAAGVLRTLALLSLFGIYIVPVTVVDMGGGRVVNTPAMPEWTSYLGDFYSTMRLSYWVMLYPGIAIAVAMLVFHLTAEGLRRRWQRAG